MRAGFRFLLLLTVACLQLASLSGCESQPLTIGREPVHLRLAVSDSCTPIVQDLVAAYRQSRPWVEVSTEVFNSAVAGQRLRDGDADLACLSWTDENSADLWSVRFAVSHIYIVVHPDVAASSVSNSQLREIFRGRIGEWEDGSRILPVSRENGAGTRAAFEEWIMAGYDVTLTATVMPSNRSVIDYVASTPGAIGYVSASWMSDEVHALQVTGENTDQAALPGQARAHELCLAAPSEPRDEVRTFIQWTLGSEAQQIVMEHLASPR